MGNDIVRHEERRDRQIWDGLHPYVYAAIAALALWFVISIWLFARDPYTDYLLAVVSGFLLIFVAIPLVLSRVERADSKAADANQPSFRSWASCEFDTWQYRLRCGHAAVEVLLPIAAIAFGMTAFGLVLFFVARSQG
jgi:hypothetical protein